MSLEFLRTSEIAEVSDEPIEAFAPYPFLDSEGLLDEELLEEDPELSIEEFERDFTLELEEKGDVPNEFGAIATLKEAGLVPESMPSFVEEIRRDARLAQTILALLDDDFYGRNGDDGEGRLQKMPLFSPDLKS